MSSLATSVEDFDRLKELTLQKLVSKEILVDPDMWEIVLRANLCDVLLTTDCCAGHFEKVRVKPQHQIYIAFLMRGPEGIATFDRLFDQLILILHEAPYENIRRMTGHLMLGSRYRYLHIDRTKRYLVRSLAISVKDEFDRQCFLALLCGVISQFAS